MNTYSYEKIFMPIGDDCQLFSLFNGIERRNKSRPVGATDGDSEFWGRGGRLEKGLYLKNSLWTRREDLQSFTICPTQQ